MGRRFRRQSGDLRASHYAVARILQRRAEISVPEKPSTCSAEWTYAGHAGRFNIAVQYFDLQGGVAHFALRANGKQIASWAADAKLPSLWPNGDNSTRYTAAGC